MADFEMDINVDFGPPAVSRAFTTTNGRRVDIQFTEPILSTGMGVSRAIVVPDASAFNVTVNDTRQTPTDVQIVSDVVRLTLATQVQPDLTVQVGYTMPTTGGRLQDPSENAVQNFTGATVDNLVVDTAVPMLTATEVTGRIVTLTFDEDLELSAKPAASAFTVVVNGSERLLQSVEIDGPVVNVTLVTPVVSSDTVSVSYDLPDDASNALQDVHGNPAESIASENADNRTPLTLSGATVKGRVLTLTMRINGQNELDSNSVPAKSSFTVRVDGSPAGLAATDPVLFDDSTVTLTLDEAVNPDAVVEVSYVQPTSGARLQDVRGVAVATFDFTMVVNTTDIVAPTLTDGGAEIAGRVVTLTFDEDLDPDSEPAITAFRVSVNGTSRLVEAVGIDGDKVRVTLVAAAGPDDSVTVTYTAPSENPLRDLSENPVEDFSIPNTTIPQVTNNTAPTLQGIAVAGATVTLTFDSELDGDSEPEADAFTVQVDGSDAELAAASPVSVSGSTVTLTLAAPTGEDSKVEVRYINPGAGNNPLRADGSSIAVETFDFTGAANNTTFPALQNISVKGVTVTLTFDSGLDEDSEPAGDAFGVRVDGNEVDLASADAVSVSGSTATLTLAEPVDEDSEVEVRYTNPGAGNNPLQDADSGLAVETFGYTAADSNTTDSTPPAVSTQTAPAVNGTTLIITFSETLDAGSVPASGDFTVTVDDAPREVTGVSVSGRAVLLRLASAVTGRQTVSVSYAPGSNPLRGSDGNAVRRFTGRAVTNATPNSPPVFPANAPATLSVPENSAGGTPVGAVVAADADGDTLQYSLDPASRALFAIGANNGAIVVAQGASLDFEGTGSHSVTVTASDGRAAATHSVTIEVTNVAEPPDPPRNVTVWLSTFNTLVVNWAPPASAGGLPVSDYDVRYYAGDADPRDPADWIESGEPGGHDHMGEATMATIVGLAPDTPYRVQVRAVGDGIGRWSESATVQTEVVPTVPFFDDGETAAFSIPENNEAEAEVGTVAASDDDGDTPVYSLTSASAEHRLFTIDAGGVIRVAAGVTLDHEEKAAYTLMAQVTDGKDADGNEEAVPEVDDTIEVSVTVENVEEPPGPPAGVTVSEATETSLAVVWTAPADAGALPVSAYEVQYRLAGTAGEWTDHPHEDTATSAEIGGLSAGTGYEVRIRAQGDGYSGWSTGEGRTLRAPPVASGELPDLALVVGAPPREVDASGVLSGQDVTWEHVSSAPSIVSVIERDGPRFMLLGETAGEARVTVTASNSSGSASVTMAVTVSITSEEEAAAIKNVFGGQARTLLGGATGVIGNRIAQWQGPALSLPSFTGAGTAAVAGGFGAGRAGPSGLHGAAPAGGAFQAVGAPAPTGVGHGGPWDSPFAFSLDVSSLGFAQTNGRRRLLPPPTRDNGPVPAPEGVPWWTVWGAGDVQTFSGGEGASAYEGDWSTAWLGTDLRIAENVMFGVALSFGEGVADYGFEGPAAGAGQLQTSLAAVYPYIKGASGDGATELWLLAGGGAGEAMNHREVQQATDEADLAMGLFAAGARLRMMEGNVIRLSLLADLGAAMLQAEGENSLVELESKAQRVRLGVELAGAGYISPFFQLNGRYDGDGEMYEAGYEAEGGLRYSGARIDFEVRGRWMALASDETEYEEAGATASLRLKAADGAGLSAALRPAWGRAGASDIVWRDGRMGAPHPAAQGAEPGLALDGELGYGIRSWRLRGLLTPTLGYGRDGYGDDRLRFGANYAANPEWLPVELGIELGIERRLAPDGPGYGGRIRGTMRW